MKWRCWGMEFQYVFMVNKRRAIGVSPKKILIYVD